MFLFFFKNYRNTKYSDDEIQEILDKYCLFLDKYEGTKSIYAHDEIGYKYHFALSNFKMGRKPDWLQGNPFALDNIKLYLSLYYPDYELLDDEYVSCKAKMRFICHKHEEMGEQLNSFDNIANNNHACKYCGYSVLSEIKRTSDLQLIDMCKDRDVKYVGRRQYNKETHILYECPRHQKEQPQEMTLDHFKASKVPCRFCQITSGELKVKQYLDLKQIPYSFQHIFPDCKNKRTLEFDFYLPTLHTTIEYDGKQHFIPMNYAKSEQENIKLFELNQRRDKIKDQYCLANGIKMIRIPYWEYENVDIILQKELNI